MKSIIVKSGGFVNLLKNEIYKIPHHII